MYSLKNLPAWIPSTRCAWKRGKYRNMFPNLSQSSTIGGVGPGSFASASRGSYGLSWSDPGGVTVDPATLGSRWACSRPSSTVIRVSSCRVSFFSTFVIQGMYKHRRVSRPGLTYHPSPWPRASWKYFSPDQVLQGCPEHDTVFSIPVIHIAHMAMSLCTCLRIKIIWFHACCHRLRSKVRVFKLCGLKFFFRVPKSATFSKIATAPISSKLCWMAFSIFKNGVTAPVEVWRFQRLESGQRL